VASAEREEDNELDYAKEKAAAKVLNLSYCCKCKENRKNQGFSKHFEACKGPKIDKENKKR
jgi:hypothetical protein